jgi:phosphoribosylaminoimidazole-succinocarboxamide synthase
MSGWVGGIFSKVPRTRAKNQLSAFWFKHFEKIANHFVTAEFSTGNGLVLSTESDREE